MPTPSQPPTLLIIASETSEAERLMAILRESRLAERSLSIPGAEHLAKMLAEHSCDLILCCGYDQDVALDQVLTVYQDAKTEIPLILLADPEQWEEVAGKARRAGARDIVRRADPEHLRLSVGRELADLQARRATGALNARLRQCEQNTLRLTEVTGAGVAFVQDGLHLEVNPAYAQLFQVSTEEVLATPLLDLIAPEHHTAIRDLLKSSDSSAPDDTAILLDISCLRPDATRFSARLLASPSEFDGEPCLRLILQPIATASTFPVATTRAVTAPPPVGLAALIAEIESHIDVQRFVTRPFAIFFIRVTKIAEVMHDLGLSIGLELLDEFSQTLATLVGERGFLSRVSDDGFGLIVDGLDALGAKALATELSNQAHLPARAAVSDPDTPDCQIGYFLVSERASAAEDIINTAYRLCIGHDYASEGPTEARETTPTTPTKDEKTAIVQQIEQALRDGQIKLLYQPIISLMGDSQENYSLLPRLSDEADTRPESDTLIETAIRRGLLVEALDKWIIRSASEVISQRRHAGQALSLFLTLSNDILYNPNIVLWICDCLREFDIRGNWLTFQFHEDVVVSNLASLSKLIETLHKIKCRVAIHHFGATNHPKRLLQALSLDFVLIRPELAQGMADNIAKQQQIKQLATLARECNVKSIVTGVEDARSMTVLWSAGVDYVQGNFLQRPSATLDL
ncbi:MAG: EAL domain-containing protein [Thermochromatium sp.]